MSSRLTPYIGFRDNAREALEFYRTVFGGELTITTFGEFGISPDPAEAGKVMHGQLETPSGYTLMAADTPNSMERPEASNVSISLSGGGEEEAELTGCYQKLIEGGSVVMPLGKAPWGDTFGMCADRFGVNWLVNITGASA